MLKKISVIILFFLFFFSLHSFAYTPYLPKGTLLRVFPRKPICTDSVEENSIVYFVNPSDIWVVDTKIIEKGDMFQGYVSMLKVPVLGINAAMSITITDIIKKNGEKKELNGKIIFPNSSDVLGGNLTAPASYNKTIHPRKVYGNNWGGTLQYVPSGEYEFGQHVYIIPKQNVFIELLDDYAY